MSPSRPLVALLVTISLLRAPPSSAAAAAPLGVTYAAWKGEYAGAARRLATFKEIGFQIVSLVPTYAYAGLNKVDAGTGPDAAELARAVEAAERAGFRVVIKPHLDPLLYSPGFPLLVGRGVTTAWIDPISTRCEQSIIDPHRVRRALGATGLERNERANEPDGLRIDARDPIVADAKRAPEAKIVWRH